MDPNVPESDFPQFTEENYLNLEITMDEIAQVICSILKIIRQSASTRYQMNILNGHQTVSFHFTISC